MTVHRVVLAEDNVPLRTLLRFSVEADPRFVVVLTGFEDHDLEQQTLQAGAAAYLTKGSAFGGLVDRLDQLLA